MTGAVRPRRGRMAAFGAAVTVTSVSLLGAAGVLPTTAGGEAAVAADRAALELLGSTVPVQPVQPVQPVEPAVTLRAAAPAAPGPAAVPAMEGLLVAAPGLTGGRGRDVDRRGLVATVAPAHPLPEASGEGRRVVVDTTLQRVWHVDRRGLVRRTYLLAGGVEGVVPGTYAVSSRPGHVDGAGTLDLVLRAVRGGRVPVGFRPAPQRRADAVALADFASAGTTVVVTA